MVPACPPSAAATYLSAEQATNASDPFQHLEMLLHRADDAYGAKHVSRAVTLYRQAAAVVVAAPSTYRSGFFLDSQLHLARNLAVLGDRKTAMVLWKLAAASQPNPFGTQVALLHRHNTHALFMAMAADSQSYASGHPDDDTTKDHVQKGVQAGVRGNLEQAQLDFNEAIRSAAYSPQYAYYALGITQWLLGDRDRARETWICGSDSGQPLPPGDIAANDQGNLAIVTILASF